MGFCVGLDMSWSSTGFAIYDGETSFVSTIRTKPKDFANDFDRMKHIVGEVTRFIGSNCDPTLIAIEDYFTPHNAGQIGAAIRLIQLGTAIRMRLYDDGMPFVVISPSQLKKFCLGKGNAQKSLILKGVYKKWDMDAADDNQADAYVLARMAWAITDYLGNGDDELVKYEKDVVKTVIENRPRFNIDLSP